VNEPVWRQRERYIKAMEKRLGRPLTADQRRRVRAFGDRFVEAQIEPRIYPMKRLVLRWWFESRGGDEAFAAFTEEGVA
jgi:hypothetical protein